MDKRVREKLKREHYMTTWAPTLRSEHRTELKDDFMPNKSMSQTFHQSPPRCRAVTGSGPEGMKDILLRVHTDPLMPFHQRLKMSERIPLQPFKPAPDSKANREFSKGLYADATRGKMQSDINSIPFALMHGPKPINWMSRSKGPPDSCFIEPLAGPLTEQRLVYTDTTSHNQFYDHDIKAEHQWFGGHWQEKVEPHPCSRGEEWVKVFNHPTHPKTTQYNIDFPDTGTIPHKQKPNDRVRSQGPIGGLTFEQTLAKKSSLGQIGG
jgi:hypothetical protein